MERYILKYLQDSTQDEWRKRYYDYMKVDLDKSLWSYGSHIGVDNYERTLEHQENYIIPRKNSLKAIYDILRRAFDRKITKKRRLQKQAEIQTSTDLRTHKGYKQKVFCAFHLPWLLPDESICKLNDIGIELDFITDTNQPWSKSVERLLNWHNSVKSVSFNELIKYKYVNELREIYNQLRDDFKETDYKAVIVYSTEVYEEKILIDVFKDLGKKTMEMLHGVPGTDPSVEASRVDEFLVYGEKIKENCIKYGCSSKHVHVVGDCKYAEKFTTYHQLRCSMENVLVMTSTTSIEYQELWEYDKFPHNDRSLLIAYLYSIENVLKKNGVTHARLRPHPHIKKEWIKKYVDMDFYEVDYLDLSESLNKATCCIGQNSTVVFEAINHGVSYMVYEPGDGKHMMTGGELVIPFDGSDPDLKIANSEDQLDEMIKTLYRPAADFGSRYMEEFKPEMIREILDK